jgi:beta-phosphoglucomutase-like phosphatase (HAD superfamily)
MFDQSKPLPGMLQLLRQIKRNTRFKLAVISNEGRELAEYRIKKFELNQLADFFIVSSFVHFRKPDIDIAGSSTRGDLHRRQGHVCTGSRGSWYPWTSPY